MNDDFPPPGDDFFDRRYAYGWVQKIADDLANEIKPDLASQQIPELRRYMEGKGLRELGSIIEEDLRGKFGAFELRAMAYAMRRYALNRPAMTGRHLP